MFEFKCDSNKQRLDIIADQALSAEELPSGCGSASRGLKTRSNEVTRRFYDPDEWESFLSKP